MVLKYILITCALLTVLLVTSPCLAFERWFVSVYVSELHLLKIKASNQNNYRFYPGSKSLNYDTPFGETNLSIFVDVGIRF